MRTNMQSTTTDPPPIIETEGFRFLNAPNRFRRMWPGMVPERIEAHEKIRERMTTEFPDAGHPVGLLMNVWDWEEYLVWSREQPTDVKQADDGRFFCLIVPERRLIRIGVSNG